MKRSMQAHANEEAKALKRGGASPRLMAEEQSEYAKKGVRFPAKPAGKALPKRKKV